MSQVPKIYDRITGGLLSKTNYPADVVISQYEAHNERLFQEAIEEAQQPMTEDQSKLAVKNIADAARAFLQCYDEFEPEQHGSCGEYLDALFDACDEFGKIDGTADIEQKET